MKRITVYVEPQTFKLLTLVAKRTRSSLSALIREAIEEQFVRQSYYRKRAARRATG